MQTISGLFDTYEHATAAVHELHDAGIAHADISFVANTPADFQPDNVGEGAPTGAEVGAGLGAASGLLAGLGVIAIPGVGPVIAGGWLFATAIGALAGAGIGAATGGLVGALTHAGVTEADAQLLAEGVKRGGAIVTARVDEAHAGPAIAILRHAEGIDIASHPPRPNDEEELIEQVEEMSRPEKVDTTPYVPPIL